MKLTLDRKDLKPEHSNAPCSMTRFDMFCERACAAIIAVGDAQFREYDGSNYNRIMPPKSAAEVHADLMRNWQNRPPPPTPTELKAQYDAGTFDPQAWNWCLDRTLTDRLYQVYVMGEGAEQCLTSWQVAGTVIDISAMLLQEFGVTEVQMGLG